MELHVPQPTLSEDTNRKLQSIRKNILHDVLKFNLQSSTHRRQQMQVRHSIELEQMNRLIDYEQEAIRRERQQNRLNVIRRKQILKQEYDRQIREKEDRKRKEKQYDRIYAKIEKDYQDVSNQRRIYDIQKMFNRKSYQATINESSRYKIGPGSVQRDRLRTEPDYHNPQYNQRYETAQKQKLGYKISGSPTPNYKDSIDRLKYPPQQPINNKMTSPTTDNVNSMVKPINVSNFRLDYN